MPGLTEEGFEKKTRVQIEQSLRNRARNLFGSNVNLDDDSPLGKIIKMMSYEFAQNWQAEE